MWMTITFLKRTPTSPYIDTDSRKQRKQVYSRPLPETSFWNLISPRVTMHVDVSPLQWTEQFHERANHQLFRGPSWQLIDTQTLSLHCLWLTSYTQRPQQRLVTSILPPHPEASHGFLSELRDSKVDTEVFRSQALLICSAGPNRLTQQALEQWCLQPNEKAHGPGHFAHYTEVCLDENTKAQTTLMFLTVLETDISDYYSHILTKTLYWLPLHLSYSLLPRSKVS